MCNRASDYVWFSHRQRLNQAFQPLKWFHRSGQRRLAVKRGDLVPVAVSGAYGKPHPAVIIQSDYFDEHPWVKVLPITTHLRETPLFRVMVDAAPANNLRSASQVMIDKAVTVPRDKVGEVFGSLDAAVMLEIDRSLALFLGIAK